MGKKSAQKMPKIQSLPSTSELFHENVKWAHIQACIWRTALDPHPSYMDLTNFGWSKDLRSKVLILMTHRDDKPQPLHASCSSSGAVAHQSIHVQLPVVVVTWLNLPAQYFATATKHVTVKISGQKKQMTN